MAEGRQQDEWQRTSSFMALLANCNKSEKGKAFTPADFNPFEMQKKRGIAVDPENVKMEFERMRNQLGGKVLRVKAKGKHGG